MLIIPSRGRPLSLARFFEVSQPRERGVVLLDEDDGGNYQPHLALPRNWDVMIGPRAGHAALINRAFAAYPHEHWYGCLGDDCRARPTGWDTRLKSLAMEGCIAFGDDLINGPATCGFPFIPGDLARTIGWLAYPSLNHLYSDSIWRDIGRELGLLKFCPEVITEHLHWSTGKMPYDETARERKTAGDRETYEQFLQTEFRQVIARCRN